MLVLQLLRQESAQMDPARERKQTWGRFRPFEKRLIALTIALLLVAASFGTYYALTSVQPGKRNIVIYTYSSFMAYGANKTAAFNTVFGTFEREYHVNITVRTLSQGLLSTLQAQKQSPQADIVIGLTNVDGVAAANDGLLVKYSPPSAAYVNKSLMSEMGSASSYLTPYEYAYLGIDYNRSVFGPSGSQFMPGFQYLSDNSTAASNLLMENPLTDSTGQGFLLWQIAYYEHVLRQNWTEWWNAVKQYSYGHIYDSWDTAFGQFGSGPNTNLVVSYLTDPAYNQFSGYGNGTGSTAVYHNGTAYGWRTIYCVGIVNGSKNIALDKAFVNYFIGPTVQNEIPLNEWMYPANVTTQLPSVFNYAVNQSSVVPLNTYLDASAIAAKLQEWELEWLAIMG